MIYLEAIATESLASWNDRDYLFSIFLQIQK